MAFEYDVVVIGGGAAGLTSAGYVGAAGAKTAPTRNTGWVASEARSDKRAEPALQAFWSGYASRNRFVVIAPGGHGKLPIKLGDALVAFALP